MYYGKKKKIILIIVIILLILVLAIGTLAFLYLKTDMFKSNQTLFYKYAIQELDNIKIEENAQLNGILELQNQLPYETNGTLKFSTQTEELIFLNNLELQTVSKIDKKDNISESNIKLIYNNTNLADISYANSNNIYALKWEDIVASYYVGIQNENLKVLAQKLDFENIDAIPDSINSNGINIEQLLKISDEEKTHIKDTYLNVLVSNIPESKYSKQSDLSVNKNSQTYNTTAYRLDLTGTDVKNLEILMLETLQKDSITLNLIVNKLKLLGITDITINDVTDKIRAEINNINSKTDSVSDGLSIMVYVANGESILSEIILHNNKKITIDNINENVSKIIIQNLSTDNDYSQIIIAILAQYSNEQSIMQINVDIDSKEQIAIKIENTGSATQSNLQTSIEISYSKGEQQSSVNYNQTMIFGNLQNQITKLTNQNCAILNNYNKEQLNALMSQIIERIGVVVQEKIIYVLENIATSEENLIKAQEIEAFNNKFKLYEGNSILGAQVKTLCDVIKANNDLESGNTKTVMLILNSNLGVTSQEDIENSKNLIDSNLMYSVELVKGQDGFITGIKVISK